MLSQVPMVALPCAPGDSTAVCHCKQGAASSCEALAEADAEALRNILRVAAVVKAAELLEKAEEESADAVDTGCGDESPNDDQTKCTGQEHHIISKKVWEELKDHPVLGEMYRYRDPRFVARAKDLKAHCGWQNWHRDLDAEIAKWVKDRRNLTPQEFVAYLREVFSRPELRVRFPNGF